MEIRWDAAPTASETTTEDIYEVERQLCYAITLSLDSENELLAPLVIQTIIECSLFRVGHMELPIVVFVIWSLVSSSMPSLIQGVPGIRSLSGQFCQALCGEIFVTIGDGPPCRSGEA